MEGLTSVSATKLFGLIIFGAIVIFQCAYILLQWYYIRKREYLVYALYMIVSFAYGLEEFEHYLPFDIFTQFDSDFHWHVHYFLPELLIFLYYQFSSLFLDLKNTRPEMNRWVNRFMSVIFVYMLFELVSNYAGLPRYIGDWIFRLVSLFITISSLVFIFIVIRNNNALARFALIGALFLLLGSLSTFLLMEGEQRGITFPIDPYLPMLIGVIAELLTFTTGLSYKSRMDSVEKIKVQDELIERMKENELMQQRMTDTRNKIARDLHDNIGSTLGSISYFSEMAQMKDGKVSKELLQKIELSSRETIESMNDIVWAIQPKNESMEAVLTRMQNFAADQLGAKQIAFDFKINEAVKQLPMTMEQYKNLFLIFKEAVYNAAKYSNSKLMTAEMKVEDQLLTLTVQDYGKGFEQIKASAYNGNGLRNMHERAKEIGGELKINSEVGKGTMVVLELVTGA